MNLPIDNATTPVVMIRPNEGQYRLLWKDVIKYGGVFPYLHHLIRNGIIDPNDWFMIRGVLIVWRP